NLPKLVVRHRWSKCRAPHIGVLDAAQSNIGVAAFDRLLDRHEGDVHETGSPTKAARDEVRDFDLEADDAIGNLRICFNVRRAAFRVTSPHQFSPCLISGLSEALRGKPKRAAEEYRQRESERLVAGHHRFRRANGCPWIGFQWVIAYNTIFTPTA